MKDIFIKIACRLILAGLEGFVAVWYKNWYHGDTLYKVIYYQTHNKSI